MKTTIYFSIILVCLFTSCATLNISTESLAKQIKESEARPASAGFKKYSFVKYEPNHVSLLNCNKKSGQNVNLVIDKNTLLKLTLKNYKYKHVKLYFNTVVIKGDTLKGSESRISALFHTINTNNIEKAEVISEFPRYRK